MNEPARSWTGRWRAQVAANARRTGDPAPGWTVGFVIVWALTASIALAPPIVGGSIPAVLGLVALAVLLYTLPDLFAPYYGTAAAIVRLSSMGVLLIAIISLGLHLWG